MIQIRFYDGISAPFARYTNYYGLVLPVNSWYGYFINNNVKYPFAIIYDGKMDNFKVSVNMSGNTRMPARIHTYSLANIASLIAEKTASLAEIQEQSENTEFFYHSIQSASLLPYYTAKLEKLYSDYERIYARIKWLEMLYDVIDNTIDDIYQNYADVLDRAYWQTHKSLYKNDAADAAMSVKPYHALHTVPYDSTQIVRF